MKPSNYDDWEVLLKVAAEYNLNMYQKILLLAIRTVENHGVGYEMGVKFAQGTDLLTQAQWAAETIVNNTTRFNALKSDGYCIGTSRTIVLSDVEGVNETSVYVKPDIDFLEFMWKYGGESGLGWTREEDWDKKIKDESKKINTYFNKRSNDEKS